MSTSQAIAAKSLIGGELKDGSGDAAYRYDPANPQRVVTQYQKATTADLDAAISAAVAAAPGFDDLGVIARGRILTKIAELIRRDVDDVTAAMVAEHGKTVAECRGEVLLSADTFDYHAGGARDAVGTSYPSGRDDEWITTVRRPLGVVAAITPWNFPLQIPAWKLAPALMAGNAVVWKCASFTPGVAFHLARIAVEAGLPAGVLNLVLGDGKLGADLVGRPEINGVTFTGSVPVGHSIRDTAVAHGAKVQLELGGHNAAVVLPDAPVEMTAEHIVAGAMGSTGQKCTATRRIILVGEGHDKLLARITEKVNALKLGAGTTKGTDIGPIISPSAAEEATDAVNQALSEGATVLAQAELPDGPGNWVAPTVLAGTPELSIAQEEVFAPITTVLRAKDLPEAVQLANSTKFGLSAAVFTTSERDTRYCVKYLDAGVIKVNAPSTGTELHGPFSGMKDSTFAGPREQNRQAANAFFTNEKTAYLRVAPDEEA